MTPSMFCPFCGTLIGDRLTGKCSNTSSPSNDIIEGCFVTIRDDMEKGIVKVYEIQARMRPGRRWAGIMLIQGTMPMQPQGTF